MKSQTFSICNRTLFMLLMSELLIETRACLSRLSRGLIDSSRSEEALLRQLSELQTTEEAKREGKRTSVFTLCCPPFTAGQTLTHRKSHDCHWATGNTPVIEFNSDLVGGD